jgi:hypothetical protein
MDKLLTPHIKICNNLTLTGYAWSVKELYMRICVQMNHVNEKI